MIESLVIIESGCVVDVDAAEGRTRSRVSVALLGEEQSVWGTAGESRNWRGMPKWLSCWFRAVNYVHANLQGKKETNFFL